MGHRRRALAVYGHLADPRWLLRGQRGIIVYAQGRSGSTLLGDLLGSHPHVVYEDEILYHPVRFPRAFVAAKRSRFPASWYAFHVKPYQLSDDQGVRDQGRWLRSMTRLGWRVVHLRRTNLLHQVLSNARAEASGRFHQRGAGDRLGPIEVDPEVVLGYLHARAAQWQVEDRALTGIDHVSLTYEGDLLPERARQATMDRVFTHLGLPHVVVSTDLRRLGADRLEDLVANVVELRAALVDTPYADLAQ